MSIVAGSGSMPILVIATCLPDDNTQLRLAHRSLQWMSIVGRHRFRREELRTGELNSDAALVLASALIAKPGRLPEFMISKFSGPLSWRFFAAALTFLLPIEVRSALSAVVGW